MFFSSRNSGTRTLEKTSRTRSRPRFVASVEAVENRMLMTGISAVSWSDGARTHSEVYAIGFDNSVSASQDGGPFVSLGGYARSISAGLDTSGHPEVFAIAKDNSLTVNDNGSGWVNRGGGCLAIAASTRGECFVLGTDNAVYTSTTNAWSYQSTPYWASLSGTKLTTISAGTDKANNPEVFAIASNYYTWSNNGSGWVNRNSAVKAIAGSTNDTFFGIGLDNGLYINRSASTGWTPLGGTVKAISGGSDIIGNPEVYGIGSDNALYSNDNGYGYASIGGYVTDIAAAGYGTAYVRCADVDLIESTRYNQTYVMVGGVPLANPASAASYSRAPSTASLFSPSNNNQPSYLDMRQGQTGDCWLDASLAEVALRAPQDIKGMFTYLGMTVDKGGIVPDYQVRLYSPSGSVFYVQVDTMLPGGGTYYNDITNASGTTSLWTALVEKAYAEANALGFVNTISPNQGSYDALNTGNLTWALQAVTGHSASNYAINPTDMASAWNSGKLIVMCTTGSTPASSAIVGSHCYAMVGYNASSSLPFEVFNPWGTQANGYAPGSSTIYGLFYANATFMSQNFTGQTYGSGSINPNLIDLPTVDTTDLVQLNEVGPRKVIKHPGISLPLITSIRPIVGSPIVGGPLS